MAGLAQPRCGETQQIRLEAPVRDMTAETALRDRSVLPEEGPALLGVAAGALVVDRVRVDELVRDRAVRVVARRAGHEALSTDTDSTGARWHVGGALGLRSGEVMALATDGGLVGAGEQVSIGDGLHDGVAVAAAEAARFVRASVPEALSATLMTLQACFGLLFLRLLIGLLKADPAWIRVVFAAAHRMSSSGPVARLAATLRECVECVRRRQRLRMNGMGVGFREIAVATETSRLTNELVRAMRCDGGPD